MNIARGRRFSMIGRSAPSSCGFSAAREPELEGRGVYGISRLVWASRPTLPTAAERRIPDPDAAPLSSA
jgi:hypothetical protein